MLGKPADLRTRESKAAQEYMSKKGYEEIRPLGVASVEDDECFYYYYEVPEGILELEVAYDLPTQRYSRQVTAFVTDPTEVKKLLEK